MKLHYLRIGAVKGAKNVHFKNLQEFNVEFDKNPSELVTVLLGRNGSGKSNLLEALVIIFRDLFVGKEVTPFAYELRYTLAGGEVHVTVTNAPDLENPRERFSLIVQRNGSSDRSFAWSAVKDGQIGEWLPRHVFAYYSGPSDRLEEHFRPHQRQFYRDLLNGKEAPIRPLFYARPVHSNFVLLAFFTKPDRVVQKFLKQTLLIEGLDSVLFVLRKPSWKGDKENGDPRFWYAKGTVQRFLAKAYKTSLAPMRLSGRVPSGIDKAETTEFQYIYLRDIDAIQELAAQSTNAAEFFKELESTYISDLIHETRIKVKVRHCDGSLTFRELSEGEQQLLTVVGLLRFTKEEESLFLLDEPDTHLNPAWGMEYLSILKKIAEPGSDSQVLLATHDPLVIAGLQRQQVRVMERNEKTGHVVAVEPEVDPAGMGVSGILKSSMFGLRTTLDLPTQEKLDRRFTLAAKGNKRSRHEHEEFRRLTAVLSDAGFATEFRDDNFDRYVQAMARVRYASRVALSPKEIGHLNRAAMRAVRKVLAEEKSA